MFFDSDGSAGLFSLISCCYGLCVLFVLCRCLSVVTQTLKRRRILAHRLEPCIAEADAKKKAGRWRSKSVHKGERSKTVGWVIFLWFFGTARLACLFWLARSCCSVLPALLFGPCLPWAVCLFCLLVWLLVLCVWLLGASGCWSPLCF